MIDTSSIDSADKLEWFKSSHSTNEGPDCVEVATAPGVMHVRDSKATAGAQLSFTDASWAAFTSFVTSHE
ncbi:DUF397 domain-containing protein [Streptomyces sp. NPDC048441]|uniref:DUF397 domain-containing protein n=1 Tax=Streptomyces sp. NPDC048441 TaxID=3365552 RepID=UPI00371BADD6